MTDQRQYVACTFRPGDVRTYTYHNDGEPVAVGDKVVVETNRGRQTVDVVSLTAEAPRFITKPIIGKAQVEAPADAETIGDN